MINNEVAGHSERFAKCIAISKRINWDIEDDVIRGRQFDVSQKFLPDWEFDSLGQRIQK